MKTKSQQILESKIRRIMREEIRESAFAKGRPESEYTLQDCVDEIIYQAGKHDFASVIYFAELAEKLGK